MTQHYPRAREVTETSGKIAVLSFMGRDMGGYRCDLFDNGRFVAWNESQREDDLTEWAEKLGHTVIEHWRFAEAVVQELYDQFIPGLVYLPGYKGRIPGKAIKRRTAIALEEGLKRWVKLFILARHAGNVKGAKQLQHDINKQIKKQRLDKDRVYFYYGDPDRPGFDFEKLIK